MRAISKTTNKKQAIVSIENKDELSEIYSVLAFPYSPRETPIKRSNKTKDLHEIKTERIGLADGLKVQDIEILEALTVLSIDSVFERDEDKTPTQLFLAENMNKKSIHEDNHDDNVKGDLDNKCD